MDTRNTQDIARHHLAVMDQLGIGRFAVVGLSIGGMWGTALALMAPERVTALVLMDSSVGPEPEASRQCYHEMLQIINATPVIPEPVLDAVVPMCSSRRIPAIGIPICHEDSATVYKVGDGTGWSTVWCRSGA